MIQQQPGERCYHIFYQVLAGADDKLLGDLLLTRQVKSYNFLANGEVSVDNVNDAEELKFTTVREKYARYLSLVSSPSHATVCRCSSNGGTLHKRLYFHPRPGSRS